MNKQLNQDIHTLFENDYFSEEFEPEGTMQDLADEVIKKYSWSDIYNCFYHYLTRECDTDIKVYNAINLFYGYGYEENPIPNPYELIGYIYYRIDLHEHWEEWGDFIDGFAVGILERCGKADLTKDPYYCSWEDKKVIESANNWRTQNIH